MQTVESGELALGQTLAQETSGGGAAHAGELPTGASRYTRGRELGRGGMGRVYEAVDQQFRRTVAVKEIAADEPADAIVRRFSTEAIVTGHLEHPGIPAVYERGLDAAGRPFYAMRRVQGRTLARLLADAGSREARLALLGVVTRAAQTVAFAHDRGVVHRDLKPDNILVGDHGETFVLDWGLARVRGVPVEDVAAIPSAGSGTQYGAVVGTPAYMAPEQATGELDRIDERTDVFALGALLYHVLAGQAPYLADTVDGLVAAAREARLAPIDPGDVPADLVAICAKATAREPAERYRDAGELAAALQGFQDRAVLGRRSPVTTLATAIMVVTLLIATSGLWLAASSVAPMSRRGISAFVLIALGVFGGGLGAIDAWTRGRHRLGAAVLGFALATFFVAVAGAAIDLGKVFQGLQAAELPAAAYRSQLATGAYTCLGNLGAGGMIAAFQLAVWGFGRVSERRRVA